MADKMRYYNVEEFNKQKAQQGKGQKAPPLANFLAAASHIRNIFQGKKLAYGVMGGLEMLCLGHHREMSDIQIAYDDRDFDRIKKKLEADQRVRLPDGMNQLFPSKILVRTGPAYKDADCAGAATVEVDLIPPGSHGTPPNGTLQDNLVLLSLKDPKLKTYNGLNMLHLVKTLVHYCRVRPLMWDPRKDVLFLCKHYGKDIEAIRNKLDHKAVQQNFLWTPFFSQLSSEDQRRCYQILLGKEPPPVMAITPPVAQTGQRHTRSASEVPRSRITSHKSSPALNMQTPELLSPQTGGNSGFVHQHGTRTDGQPVKFLASPQSLAELPAAVRDVHSRYRRISAPNSRKASSEAIQTFSRSEPKPMASPRSYELQRGNSRRTHSTSEQDVMNSRSNAFPTPGLAQSVFQLRDVVPNGIAGPSDPILPLSFVAGRRPFQVRSEPGPGESKQSAYLFELDAAPRPNAIVAELSADIDTVLHIHREGCLQPREPPTKPTQAISCIEPTIETLSDDSPNSLTATASGPSQHQNITGRLKLYEKTSPPTLPTSLMAGGLKAHRSHQTDPTKSIPCIAPQLLPVEKLVTETNASKYSRYYSPPSSNPGSNRASPLLDPASTYKAYHPPEIPVSPAEISRPCLALPERSGRPESSGAFRETSHDVQHYLETHRRNISNDSQASNTSHDSSKLAQEYQAELPDYGHGYK